MIAIAMDRRVFGAARFPERGYRPTYRTGATCPGCGGGAWHVGRATAQCARCSTALPLADGSAA